MADMFSTAGAPHPPGSWGRTLLRSLCRTSASPGKAPPWGWGSGVSCQRHARLLGTSSMSPDPQDLLLRLSLASTGGAGLGSGT
uniref:Uncharacterized protein n=1 Tax=Pyxicephalus adspersus TaxID=30357 RepID=A0AAV3B459_PYXAD|nr:TPA: hypothetical protein GDO54_006007 [Pyxicephalus adspersus]